MIRAIAILERWLFGHRGTVLIGLLIFTAAMAVAATGLHMDAGYQKQMPLGHPYTRTIAQYRGELFEGNRLTVVVRARQGNLWTAEGLARLYAVTEAVRFLPHVDRQSVQSLWTPSAQVYEITEDGFRAEPLIASTVTPDHLTPGIIADIERSTSQGGFVGSLVSRDQGAAMIIAELAEFEAQGRKIDYVAFNHEIEAKIRAPFEDTQFEIQIIGFAKQIGDIADGAGNVLYLCAVAILLTMLAVYWYCRSLRFTVLPIACSLTSLIWQFGTLTLLGFGLDPLAILVPFLVFAIGVSHGVQQINFIIRELAAGKTMPEAARASFSGLLVPGTLALVTALVSFLTLLLIPIPMIRELAITASLGVGYKIVTNLIMLPLAASFLRVTASYGEQALRKRIRLAPWLKILSRVAEPRVAPVIVAIGALLLVVAVWQSRDRVIGSLQPGADELAPQSRYNQAAVSIAGNFDIGLDWLTVVVEAPPGACQNPALGKYVDDLTAATEHAPGVTSAASYSEMLKTYNEGYNEGNPKMFVVPIDAVNYTSLTEEIRRSRGYVSSDCRMAALHLYLTDHRARTIAGVIRTVEDFARRHAEPGFTVRLAAGNAGAAAAINDEVEKSELPMMLYVYGAIITLVFLVYRDLRATLSCCLPLTVGTYVGYWFMKILGIGLTVATLPVMVLAVGIGVDYAFYIYNRLQLHLSRGEGIVPALEKAIQEVGTATIFTAVTLSAGVASWSFSALRFQADMGKLLSIMFLVNLVMAMTVLPALAVVLERMFPRRRRTPGVG
jgi:hypothetical protein